MSRRQRELDERERRMDAGEGKANWPFCTSPPPPGPHILSSVYHLLNLTSALDPPRLFQSSPSSDMKSVTSPSLINAP
jgi:hypothetical protein